MQLSRVILIAVIFAHVLLSEAFFLSLGLVGLGVAGLAGLKLYYGMKLFGPSILSAREGNIHGFKGGHMMPASGHHPVVPAASGEGSHTPQIVVLPIAFNPKESSHGVPVSIRVRRDLPGRIQLSGKLLHWLSEVDDKRCIHRYFCDLGSNQSKFGNLGRITNMVILMGGLPKNSWAQEMYIAGQNGKQCPAECDEKELAKTVSYLERHLFVDPYSEQEQSKLSDNSLA